LEFAPEDRAFAGPYACAEQKTIRATFIFAL